MVWPSRMTDGSALNELVEEVDVEGNVIDVVTRRAMRAGRLRHRCTYVVVLTSDDEIVVHQRADWKEVYPSFWDVAFGGVCGVGEGWLASAERELAEEAGIVDVVLEPIGSVHHESEAGAVVGEAFVARSDAEATCPDGEVVAVERLPLSDLESWLDGRDVCADSRDGVLPLLDAYLQQGQSANSGI